MFDTVGYYFILFFHSSSQVMIGLVEIRLFHSKPLLLQENKTLLLKNIHVPQEKKTPPLFPGLITWSNVLSILSCSFCGTRGSSLCSWQPRPSCRAYWNPPLLFFAPHREQSALQQKKGQLLPEGPVPQQQQQQTPRESLRTQGSQ